MSAALRPDQLPDFDPEEGPRIRVLHIPRPEPTPADIAQMIATTFAANLVGIFLATLILVYSWNSLNNGLSLPDFNFNQAFTGVVILRVLALTVRL